ARLNGPIVFGVLRPTVGLPADFVSRFSPAQQEAMLAHELAHLASHDPGWYSVADLAAAVLWWHPMVWWARHQLHVASEQAADEASLLVADGPGVLAECLVKLGVRLTRPPSFVSLGIEGNGFRSGLGRRVERLLTLRGHSWCPPNRTRSVMIKAFGPGILVAAVILSTAWAGPQAFTKGESMKTMKQTWKQSLAAFALLMSLGADSSLIAPTTNADDQPIRATPAPEETKPTPAEGKPPATDPASGSITEESPQRAPFPYNRELMERYGLIPKDVLLSMDNSAKKRKPDPIASKLEQIVLNEVMFNDVPLPEVLKFLNDESRKRDPEKRGLNFLINPNVAPIAGETTIDPTTGQPVQLPSPEPLDMNSVVVRINLPLRDVRLKDVLDAVVKVADKPIEYSIEEYGVVFSQKTNRSTSGVDGQPVRVFDYSPPLLVRTFKVDTNAILAGLQRTFGIGIEATKNPPATRIRAALRDVFSNLGINMDVSGKTVFYNDLTGIVMVRATADDLEIVKAAIETLGGAAGDSTALKSSGTDGPAPYPAMREEMMRRYGLLPAKK
ncbi:MAG TPA: M56 family metallopeptidase, partial [Candidatus Angelobacter sp.]|nr:M56 family metallopeptidase [Candidatus Angelobacter sp.]